MRIGIVGAGLLGAGTALELALRGHDVEIFEREPACLTQASRQNEGKVHLGFVYAHDASLATARLMARGAFAFGPLLSRWLERGAWPVDTSTPFHYFVHRDTLVPPDDLAGVYCRIVDILRDEASRPGACYLRDKAPFRCRRLGPAERARLADDAIVDAYDTSEYAIDPEPLAGMLRSRLAEDPRITVHLRTTVTRVTPGADGVAIALDAPGGRRTARFDHVVNASWSDLLRLDRTAGVEPRGPWSFRLKHYVRLRTGGAVEAPSATIVLGPFGDVVRYAGGDLVLSWYPAGCTGLSLAIRHPDTDTQPTPDDEARIRTATRRALCSLVPALRDVPRAAFARAEVEGGIILAQGTTDVSDPASGLHARTRVGPRSHGRYHSVDPGKWTTAPFFAHELARRIAEGA